MTDPKLPAATPPKPRKRKLPDELWRDADAVELPEQAVRAPHCPVCELTYCHHNLPFV